MKKLTKKERVENYLSDLTSSENFSVEKLSKMTVYDLIDNPVLKGIGKTTISASLNYYKKQYGLKKSDTSGEKSTKKEKVEKYLTEFMNAENFTIKDLLNLSVYDLLGNAELEGIGKTTLSDGINTFKKKYLDQEKTGGEHQIKIDVGDTNSDNVNKEEPSGNDSGRNELKSFENAFISVINKDDGEKQNDQAKQHSPLKNNESEIKFQKTEVELLQEMIGEYKKNKDALSTKESSELTELKLALKYFGINYKKIVSQYKKCQKYED